MSSTLVQTRPITLTVISSALVVPLLFSLLGSHPAISFGRNDQFDIHFHELWLTFLERA